MNRRERIVFLLENYLDVENGLQDRGFRGDEFIPRMCRAWNHPSYVELRRCVALLQTKSPCVFGHLQRRYFNYEEVRKVYCPRCLRTAPAWLEGHLHKHGQKTFTLIPKTVRATHQRSNPLFVEMAIDFISEQFAQEPFIPDDLLAVAA